MSIEMGDEKESRVVINIKNKNTEKYKEKSKAEGIENIKNSSEFILFSLHGSDVGKTLIHISKPISTLVFKKAMEMAMKRFPELFKTLLED